MSKLSGICAFLCAGISLADTTRPARISSARSGNWADASTWEGRVIPGAGDSVAIADGHTVSVSDSRSIGAFAPAAPAVNLGAKGSLLITGGGYLRIRGNVIYTSGVQNRAVAVTVQSGGIWEFDSSNSTAAANTFTFGPNGDFGFRPFIAAGTSVRHAIVRSSGGENGKFSLNGHNYGGFYQALWTDFMRIGDASHPGWEGFFFREEGNELDRWDVQHSTFTGCGEIVFQGNPDGNPHWIHSFNVHAGTVSKDGIMRVVSLINSPGRGILEMKNNVFDVALNASRSVSLGGFTLNGNYFGGSLVPSFGGGGIWVRFFNNFLIGGEVGFQGDASNSYIFMDGSAGNPHVVENIRAATTFDGLIWGHSGAALGAADHPPAPGPKDSGEFIGIAVPEKPAEIALKNSILLPNARGYSSLEIGALTGPNSPNIQAVLEHNTWFGGYQTATDPFAALQLSEGGNVYPGQVHSFRSNILFNPQLPGFTAPFWKTDDIGNHGGVDSKYEAGYNRGGGPTKDACLPSRCDFNTGWNYAPVNPADTTYKNQGRGYSGNWSSTPGAHDVDQNPQFVDFQRTVELFDSKYLKKNPAAWLPTGKYSVGDMVKHSVANVYWGLPVNYRYTNSAGCSLANVEPGVAVGVYDSWKKCWEFASLYDLRKAIAASETFDDKTIGAAGDDVISALMKWIRAGYAPRNQALKGAAHDGKDIGAVPVVQ